MKEGFDKEIDSLLRRKGGAAALVRDAAPAEEHLGADELSAFAEGVLPTAARVAVASHLADCGECRGVAVGLARVSEVGAESRAAPGASAATTARRGGWLSSLFAPRVLKYAAPAVALCLVAAVSFVALRSRSERGGTTQKAGGESPQVAAVREQEAGAAVETAANANANMGVLSPVAADEPVHTETHTTDSLAPVQNAQEHDVPDGPSGVAKSAEAPAPPPPAAAAVEAPAGSAATSAPPKPAQPEEDETAKKETKPDTKDKGTRRGAPEDESGYAELAQQNRAARSRVNEVQMPDGARNQTRAGSNNTSNASPDSGGSVGATTSRAERAGSGALSSRRTRPSAPARDRVEDGEAMRADETRSAAGHRFRRVGGAWVDVNYKSSMNSTGVRRGTEAFRALVADIPELGRIAAQLGGEVVVVVRGRAYRIR